MTSGDEQHRHHETREPDRATRQAIDDRASVSMESPATPASGAEIIRDTAGLVEAVPPPFRSEIPAPAAGGELDHQTRPLGRKCG